MDDYLILFTSERAAPEACLRELGISDDAVSQILVIPAAAFRLTYGSALNKGVFDQHAAERVKQAASVCAARLSIDATRTARASGRTICADAAISWDAVTRVHQLSAEYAQLAERMEATETKCMTIERNSIWRRDLQESYEYLDRELERVGAQLKLISLSL